MRSSWGEPTKSSVAPAKPTWPAGFDFGRLYADQDGAGAAQLRFADQVQLFFFRGTGDHPHHHPDDVSRGVTVIGMHSAAAALEHWQCSTRGWRFVLEHATHNIDQAVSYVRGRWEQATTPSDPATNPSITVDGFDKNRATAVAYDVHDTFVHSRLANEGETGPIESVTSTWRPRPAPLTPSKTLEHPADKLLTRIEQPASQLGDTEKEIEPPSTLRTLSESNPGSRRGSLRRVSGGMVSFGHIESYTIPGPDDTMQPHRLGLRSSPVVRSRSSSSGSSQKEMRARRRKSLKEKRLSINSLDATDSGEEASLRLLVRASVEALSAAESDNVRGALWGLGSGVGRSQSLTSRRSSSFSR